MICRTKTLIRQAQDKTLYEKEDGMPLRKLADLVEIKLGLKVARSTIHRIVKSKEEILAIPGHCSYFEKKIF